MKQTKSKEQEKEELEHYLLKHIKQYGNTIVRKDEIELSKEILKEHNICFKYNLCKGNDKKAQQEIKIKPFYVIYTVSLF